MGLAVVLIFLPIIIGTKLLSDTIAFRMLLKKKMVRAVPELEQPKNKEDAVAMRQVFEEIGFFDYLTAYDKVCAIVICAVYSLFLPFLFFFVIGMFEDADLSKTLCWAFLMILPLSVILGLASYLDYRKERGFIRKCRDAESLSACSEEDCVSYFQYLRDI